MEDSNVVDSLVLSFDLVVIWKLVDLSLSIELLRFSTPLFITE